MMNRYIDNYDSQKYKKKPDLGVYKKRRKTFCRSKADDKIQVIILFSGWKLMKYTKLWLETPDEFSQCIKNMDTQSIHMQTCCLRISIIN